MLKKFGNIAVDSIGISK